MKINIAISAYNRPEYSRRSLAAILGAKGYSRKKYNIFCSIDCDENGEINEDVYSVYSSIEYPMSIRASMEKLGCNKNVRSALDIAWEDNPDFVLMIEDDVVISDDALQYIEWAAEKYKNDQSVRTIGLWGYENKPEVPVSLKNAGKVKRQNFFTCWGWGTWSDRWSEIKENWTTGNDSHDTSWDVVMSQNLGDRVEILPAISRAYNCGDDFGTHRGRSWPGIVASGVIDPDEIIQYWEFKNEPIKKNPAVYVVLGRFGDIFMVCNKLKKPSVIACLEEFSSIVEELFPQHACIKLDAETRKNPYMAQQILCMTHPDYDIIICQQDGTPLEDMKEFRSFQTYQEYYASI
jgi:hypothetical protein